MRQEKQAWFSSNQPKRRTLGRQSNETRSKTKYVYSFANKLGKIKSFEMFRNNLRKFSKRIRIVDTRFGRLKSLKSLTRNIVCFWKAQRFKLVRLWRCQHSNIGQSSLSMTCRQDGRVSSIVNYRKRSLVKLQHCQTSILSSQSTNLVRTDRVGRLCFSSSSLTNSLTHFFLFLPQAQSVAFSKCSGGNDRSRVTYLSVGGRFGVCHLLLSIKQTLHSINIGQHWRINNCSLFEQSRTLFSWWICSTWFLMLLGSNCSRTTLVFSFVLFCFIPCLFFFLFALTSDDHLFVFFCSKPPFLSSYAV